MSRISWKSAVLCCALMCAATLPMMAQNATSGGDQQSQPDAQSGAQSGAQRGGGRRGAGGPRRGGGMSGIVTAVSGANVTFKDEAGATWTAITTDNTRITQSQQVLPISGVKPGDELVAIGVPDADKHEIHAVMLMDISAADVAKAKANLGKTYIVGRVTAIDDVKVTVMRTDKVSQVITLDESTSLHKGGRMNAEAMQSMGIEAGMMGGMGMGGGGGRRGGQGAAGAAPAAETGEAITLADVKVGDTVMGVGSVKGGSFVPTDLRVQERPAGGGRRRGPNGGGAVAPPAAPPQ